MLNINHILFPIDFSERCCGAVPFVESMASRYAAKVTLLSAAPAFYYGAMGEFGGPVIFDAQDMLGDLRTRLDSALTRNFSGLRVDRVAKLGDPAQVITEFAHTQGVDLIMMPTRGYGPFRNLLLGSVAAKVLHDAECPVWSAAHVPEAPCRDHIACKKILCAVDTAPTSVALMKWANDFSEDCGAKLRLVHAIRGMEGVPSRQMDREFEEEMREEARHTIRCLQELAGTTVPLCVVSGSIAESVCAEALRHEADLVVIGRGALQGTLGRLRTHAYGIIRQSPCPVLSV